MKCSSDLREVIEEMNSLVLKLWRRKFSMRKGVKRSSVLSRCTFVPQPHQRTHTHRHTNFGKEKKKNSWGRSVACGWVSPVWRSRHGRIPLSQSVSRQLHSSAAERWLRARGTMAALRIYKAQLSRGRPEVTSDWSGAKPLGCLKHGGSVLGLFSDSSRQHLTGVR